MLAFIHIRKTAGSTIESILRSSFGIRHCGARVRHARNVMPILSADELDRCRFVYPNLESVSGHSIVPYAGLRSRFPEIRFFTFLRDPLERCASDFQFRVANGGLKMSFDDWIDSPVARNRQTVHLCGRENAETAIGILEQEVGFVGIVEQFHRSLVMWNRWCNDRRVDIRYQPKNVSRKSTIKRQLLGDLQTRRKLVEANREDLRLYNHVLHSTFPWQEEDYGPNLQRDVSAFEAFNIPRATFPRQLISTFVRELIYKPVVPWLTRRENPPLNSDSVSKRSSRREAA